MAVANETVEQGMWNCAWRRTVNTPTTCIWNICYMLSLIYMALVLNVEMFWVNW